MTPLEAQRILDTEVIYKDYSFHVKANFNDEIWLTLTAFVKDACSGYSYKQAGVIRIKTQHMFVDSYFESLDKNGLIRVAYDMCRRLELHELDEHFKVNNKCYKDPHPEFKRA
jgi:hypothetical protein